MTKKIQKGRRETEEPELRTPHIQEEALRIIYALLFFIISIFLILSAIKMAGPAGEDTYIILNSLFGIGYYLLPLLFIAFAIIFLRSMKKRLAWPKLAASVVFLLACLGIISTVYKDTDNVGQGGLVGNIISVPLVRLFDIWVSVIFLSALLIIAAVIIFQSHLSYERLAFWRVNKDEGDESSSEFNEANDSNVKEKTSETKTVEPLISGGVMALNSSDPDEQYKKAAVLKKTGGVNEKPKLKEEEFAVNPMRMMSGKPFTPPPLSLLQLDRGKPGVGDIKANANIIKRTLHNFGINVEMDEISIGPSVTRYALKPAEGVKLSRIVGLQNDLALALAAHPIRIEAPIPGKSLVGIEIPNSTKTTVGLGTLLSADEIRQSDKPLMVALGKGISGKSHFANLAKMPHLLIAGATGSGKSVTIHAVLTSLLYRNSPDNLKFIMVDPKRVELTLYNRIPHLLTPVITDAKKSILALKWAGKEMDRRYDILESEKVRDIESYHKNILAPALKKVEKSTPEEKAAAALPETMPYIVIIIDELADLMQAYPRELESSIVRLAQMSRAVGIHLILSTQRPSVNVITGLIKANVPSRIALQVASQIDSRTILDSAGAEKLLGAGDMLFQSGEMSKPQRVQSAYISETEVKDVVKYLIENYADELPNEINLTESATDKNSIFESGIDDKDSDDDLYEAARDAVIEAGKASTSYLQRKLRIGYGRAARLIDILEERGVIGASDGARPRSIIGAAGGEKTEVETAETSIGD